VTYNALWAFVATESAVPIERIDMPAGTSFRARSSRRRPPTLPNPDVARSRTTCFARGPLSPRVSNDARSQAHDILPRIHPVPVDRVASRPELPARVPSTERREAHAKELSGLADREQIHGLDFSPRRHRGRLSNVDQRVNGA